MKKLLLLLIYPLIGFSQHTTIPDKAFEETLINLGYDTVLDGKVLTANIIGVKRLEFNALQNQSHLSISDFTGIHNFKALEELSIKFLNLESIDLSNNKELIYLNIKGNRLTSLDLSNHPSLTYLDCESNQLKNLNLSNNKALIYLSCRDNELTDLDLSNNILLAQLYCDRAQLNSLNLGNNFVEINDLKEEKRLKIEKEKRDKTLFYILVFLTVFVFLTAIWYLTKPKCPECKKKVFKSPEVLSSKYTDTTPQKKGGGRDKRYNQTGYWSKLKEWTCNCGYSWQKWV